jgi:hypothetical protein
MTCTVTATASTLSIAIWTWDGSGANIPGDITKGIYIWGADLRPASQATGLIGPTYQRVAAATVYDTAGFLPYLAFDGLDDSMSTNSIDFSATDKMTVWAGVRKLANSDYPTICELSVDSGVNNGAFSIYASGSVGAPRYPMGLRGTTATRFEPETYTAPITNVLAVSYDIDQATRATEIVPRVNGIVNQTNGAGAADAGSGNFGNYPLYIGMRNNASLPFNGWLTSLIVRGTQSTQSQIEATEAWVAGKTGVQL